MEFTFTNELNESQTLRLFETVKQQQENFLQSKFGQAVNAAIDGGLKAILPSFIEEEVIDIKNVLLNEGLAEGIQTAVNTAIEKGKEIIGMATGNIESIDQIENLSKDGKLIKGVANVLETVVDKMVKNDSTKETIGNIIKAGENIILNSAEKNIENLIEDQVKGVSKVKEAIDNWKKYYEKQNFSKMETEYKKIKSGMKQVMALENVINEANEIENIHNLIKNNGNSFDLSEEALEVAKKLM